MEQQAKPTSPLVLAYESPRRRRGSAGLATLLSVLCMALWLSGVPCLAMSLMGLIASIVAGDSNAEFASAGGLLAGFGICCVADRLGSVLPGVATGDQDRVQSTFPDSPVPEGRGSIGGTRG